MDEVMKSCRRVLVLWVHRFDADEQRAISRRSIRRIAKQN